MASLIVDLRSDTVTKPSPAMRQAMATAEVGDDVYREDPTLIKLEERCAKLLGKEKSLFVPSGTMSNLIACMCHCEERGSELIIGDKSHIAINEQGNIAQFGGIFPRILPNQADGTLNFDQIKSIINPGTDVHSCRTKLICLENTHNFCGGKILPMEYLANVSGLAQEHNIKVHLDGARLLNASVALKISPSEITKYFDSVSFCLSKGIGAPVGSVLAGTSSFIQRALRYRKAIGGGMRQAGILAAAGMVALDNAPELLKHDHYHAKRLAEAIESGSSGILQINSKGVETNIILFKISKDGMTPSDLIARLLQVTAKEKEILGQEIVVKCGMAGPENIRFVTNCDVSAEDVDLVIKKLNFVLREMIEKS